MIYKSKNNNIGSILGIGYNFNSQLYGAFQSYYKDKNVCFYNKIVSNNLTQLLKNQHLECGISKEIYMGTWNKASYPIFIKNTLTNIKNIYPSYYEFFLRKFNTISDFYYCQMISETHTGIDFIDKDITLYFYLDNYKNFREILSVFTDEFDSAIFPNIDDSNISRYQFKCKILPTGVVFSCTYTSINLSNISIFMQNISTLGSKNILEKSYEIYSQLVPNRTLYNFEFAYNLSTKKVENIVFFFYPRFGSDTINQKE